MIHARIPSLDGFRALSIMCVVVAHLYGCTGAPIDWLYAGYILPAGNFGVRVFFIISGFLITTLLLREVADHGKIDLIAFYYRRVFRILPAYAFYVGVIAILAGAGVYELTAVSFLPALTCTTNYHINNDWLLGHLWSLCVEEQFYLLWPVAVAYLGLRRGFGIAASMLLVGPLVRTIYFIAPPTGRCVTFLFETNCDALATGCLLAGFRNRLWDDSFVRRLLESRWMIAVPVVVVGAGALGGGYARSFNPNLLREVCLRLGVSVPTMLKCSHEVFGITVMNIGIALCIEWSVRFDRSAVGRILNWRPLTWIGVMSYSIYLWQQPFLNVYDRRPWTQYPLNLVLTLATAMVSYYLVELPMLRVRGRIGPWIRQMIVGREAQGQLVESGGTT